MGSHISILNHLLSSKVVAIVRLDSAGEILSVANGAIGRRSPQRRSASWRR